MKNVSGSGWPGYFRLRFCRQFGLNINVAIKNKEMLRDQAELVCMEMAILHDFTTPSLICSLYGLKFIS